MRIKYYLTFNDSNRDVKNFIEKLGIHCNGSYGTYSFNIYHDDENFIKLEPYIKTEKIMCIPANAKYEYSKDEINKAEWFCIRSTHHWSYPQPEDEYTEITYDNSNYCIDCGQGLIQKDFFRIKKEPQWGRRNFLHLNWVYDELFINDRIIGDFIYQQFTGIELLDVIHVKKNEALHTVKQVKINNILNNGMIIENPQEIIKCKTCGREKYILGLTSIYKYKKEVFNTFKFDFGKSYEIFGGGLIASRKNIVSKRVINYILNSGYNEIEYIPIQLE